MYYAFFGLYIIVFIIWEDVENNLELKNYHLKMLV